VGSRYAREDKKKGIFGYKRFLVPVNKASLFKFHVVECSTQDSCARRGCSCSVSSHRSRQTGNPPNRQPVTVDEEERGGRGQTLRLTSMKAAPDCRQPLTARHATQPRASTSHPPATRLSPQGAAPLHGEGGQLRRRTASPHGRPRAEPGPRPPPRPPRHSSPTQHVPRQQQQAGGKEDILSSETGPSTAICSKDVTTHQHLPGARPGSPCPVPAYSGQPLPCERRFSSARCHHASASARSPSWPPMPSP
jgi:hypothetical protein